MQLKNKPQETLPNVAKPYQMYFADTFTKPSKCICKIHADIFQVSSLKLTLVPTWLKSQMLRQAILIILIKAPK